MQAWGVPTTEWLGRWTCVCNSMCHTSWAQLYLQVYDHGTGRDPLVARSCPVAPSNCLWCPHHPPQSWSQVSIPKAPQGVSHYLRYPAFPYSDPFMQSILWILVANAFTISQKFHQSLFRQCFLIFEKKKIITIWCPRIIWFSGKPLTNLQTTFLDKDLIPIEKIFLSGNLLMGFSSPSSTKMRLQESGGMLMLLMWRTRDWPAAVLLTFPTRTPSTASPEIFIHALKNVRKY